MKILLLILLGIGVKIMVYIFTEMIFTYYAQFKCGPIRLIQLNMSDFIFE